MPFIISATIPLNKNAPKTNRNRLNFPKNAKTKEVHTHLSKDEKLKYSMFKNV